jgi:hypothetical protein
MNENFKEVILVISVIIIIIICGGIITGFILFQKQSIQNFEPGISLLNWTVEGDHWVAQYNGTTYKLWNQSENTSDWAYPASYYAGGGHPGPKHIEECHWNATPEFMCSEYCKHHSERMDIKCSNTMGEISIPL